MSQNNTSLLALTMVAASTIAANRFVTSTCAQAGADANTLGVCRQAAVTGDKVTVDVDGTVMVETGAAITAGATLKSDASGRAIPWSVTGAKVAIALEGASGAGQFIEALLVPNAA